MRYVITHLKAPWPLGAVVGDVLELATVPVWAVGKCKPVEDGAELAMTDGGDPLQPVDDAPAADPVFVVNPSEAKPAKGKAK